MTVLGATASGYKYLMASIGVHALYDCAEYPFILYVNWANFEGTETNGYGEEIQRATVKGYATNSAGDFEDLYAVIIRCKCGLFQPHKRRFCIPSPSRPHKRKFLYWRHACACAFEDSIVKRPVQACPRRDIACAFPATQGQACLRMRFCEYGS